MKASLGFTLIELVVTLTVLAILATVALPSYQNFVLTQRVRGASYDLMTSLVFARSEAIKRNASVSMTQAAGGWAQGWTVSAGALTLRTQDPYGGGVNITNSAALTTITYSNDGRLASPTTDFTVAPADSSAQVQTRCMSIRLGGMPSSKTGSC
ncbi:MAG TPA: GspH/FimT family pseudopilin [Burkholderiales bacterium]|jgi:type IV fimbrial biogenesis protein FimT|nr:GspH/FimT family pseudopilin [Burkholderiales bacterium]